MSFRDTTLIPPGTPTAEGVLYRRQSANVTLAVADTDLPDANGLVVVDKDSDLIELTWVADVDISTVGTGLCIVELNLFAYTVPPTIGVPVVIPDAPLALHGPNAQRATVTQQYAISGADLMALSPGPHQQTFSFKLVARKSSAGGVATVRRTHTSLKLRHVVYYT